MNLLPRWAGSEIGRIHKYIKPARLSDNNRQVRDALTPHPDPLPAFFSPNHLYLRNKSKKRVPQESGSRHFPSQVSFLHVHENGWLKRTLYVITQ